MVRRLRAARAPGVIVVNASSAGLFAMPGREVYSAAKAGAVHFTRSLAHLAPRDGIRVCAVCPRFADTNMVARMRVRPRGSAAAVRHRQDTHSRLPRVRRGAAQEADPVASKRLLDAVGGKLLRVSEVVDGIVECMADESNAGRCMHIAPGVPRAYWRFAGERTSSSSSGAKSGGAAAGATQHAPPSAALAAWATALPPLAARVEVHALSADFRAATRIARSPPPPLAAVPPGHVLVRRLWAGVNASDVNFSSGRYFGAPAAAAARLPFTAGFEAVGVVAAVGAGVRGWAPGAPCGSFSYGGFAEYGIEDAATLLPIGAAPSPEAVALLTSGLTASIALEQAARLAPGDTVLVTAAAGGTGQFAVQLAALAGATVVATCGGPDKAALLRRLGAHRVIDYTAEDVKTVLRKEYPRGIDVVYESVGGAMFDAALGALAPRGRLVVIGAISAYASGWDTPSVHAGLTEKLLWKSASCTGFFLPLHARHFRRHLARLVALRQAGKLQVALDPARFVGLERAADAVEHLHSGRSLGKVVLQIPRDLPALAVARL